MFNVYYFFTMKLSNFKRLPNRIKYEFASSKRTRIFYVKISVRSTWTLKWTEYGAFRWWTWWILFILKFGSNWTSYKKNTQKLPKKNSIEFDSARFEIFLKIRECYCLQWNSRTFFAYWTELNMSSRNPKFFNISMFFIAFKWFLWDELQ